MGKIGIITESGIEEIIFDTDKPKLIFGLSNAPAQKKERKSIGHALVKTGLEVYATDTLWPNDSYVSNNELAIAERYFGDLAHGGNYIFGDGFVLVSSAIKDNLEERLKDSEHFRKFFSGSEVIFVPPYSKNIKGIEGSKLRPWHIDVTANYVPGARLLSVARCHYHQEKELFEELGGRFGIDIKRDTAAKLYPNNFFAVRYDGKASVIANRYNNPFKDRKNAFEVIETDADIINLPGKFGGSVKCAVNAAPTTKLWDALGIEYIRWGINPKQPSYAMH